MAITKTFKDSRDINQGCGYFGYIEDGQLVLSCETPRGCEVYFRGDYHAANACAPMVELKKHDRVLYDDINNYFKQQVKERTEDIMKKYSFDEETKTVLFKTKIYNKNGAVHNCLVRGRFQADVIKKLMPQIPEVLTIQTVNADVFAIRSSEISAIEFVED